ncbi:hypothetical protein ACKKBG_A16595 [Auxenochlorella protothecoides x Auxenochlorella symbiontica]|uniref:Uncharacterized protein n=2 Tax=Auxenochlorella protothecoides TaxID=3075 RepID=A0A3M7KZ42_AUXPR|nr:hypothetical protein APUTEX25_001992 [Auxenochlorella protothecoides]|eukprot:RMZ54416.1 hypothetical protein APUTEX25_001992 [Auxenochlorella protothecoides]
MQGVLTPEGRWSLVAERRTSHPFNPETPSTCVICHLPDRKAPVAVFNLPRALFLCALSPGAGSDSRLVEVRGTGPGPATASPTCVAFTPEAQDGLDLLVGMASGEVLLLSLAGCLAQPNGGKPVPAAIYNEAGVDTPARAVSVQWIPGTNGGSFIATHADGAFHAYHRILGQSSDKWLLHRTNSEVEPLKMVPHRTMSALSRGCSVIAAMSPAGDAVALAGRDGRLAIHAYPTGACIGGFKSYYGGLTCVAWSADGYLVAAGGEDDLITVYSLVSKAVAAVCQGHSSWITGAAFDPWTASGTPPPSPEATPPSSPRLQRASASYRLASVGQDCQLLLWEVSAPAVRAATRTHSVRSWRGVKSLDPGSFAALRRGDMPLVGPLVQQRMTADPLSSVTVSEQDVLLSSYGGGILRLCRAGRTQ